MSRRVPKAEKTILFRKFHAVAAIIFLCYFLLTTPIITSYSFVSNQDYEYPKNLETTDAIEKQTQEHHRRLEHLEMEVKSLRAELYQIHRHYGAFVLMLVAGTISVLLNSAFFSKKDNSQNDDV